MNGINSTNWEIFRKPLIIAHRGNTESATENTLEAVESAIHLGVDGIEVDLQITQDNEIVVFHDDDLKRLAHTDHKIHETPLATLKKIRLKNGESIPTLEELLDLTRDKLVVNLELKMAPSLIRKISGALENRVTEKLKNYRHRSTLLISSFFPMALVRMKQANPDLKYGYLFENKFWLHRNLMALVQPFSVNAPVSEVSSFWVKKTHRAKRKLLVWTVNRKGDIEKCLRLNVDGIITDKPRDVQKKIQEIATTEI